VRYGFCSRGALRRSAVAGVVVVVGLAAASGALAALLSTTAGANSSRYPIRVEAVSSASSSSQQVVVTGAFADAGQLTISGPVDTLALSKGTIVLNLAAGEKAENTLFNHLNSITNPKSCGVNGSYKSLVKLVSGTGFYQGITGSITMTTQEIGVFPKSPDGSCNLSSSATPIGFLSVASGVGTASIRES
jgi:hypothetical protein